MVVSMTGYGQGKRQTDTFSITIEVKTVNHRFTEYFLRIPKQFLKLEDKIKKTLNQYIKRGRIEVYATIEQTGSKQKKIRVDWDLLDEFYRSMTEVKEKYMLSSEPGLKDLLNDDVFAIVEVDEDDEWLDELIIEATNEAGKELQMMRLAEGKELEKDLFKQLGLLTECLNRLYDLAPNVVKQYEDRLRKRMEEYADGHIDESRIITEVAIFADKADINEELTRLASHRNQFQLTLSLDDAIGRKLDFMIQEMNREVNTIGSKANDSTIAGEVVEMKGLLEKMKEQVQNIE
ncbi:MULTISPECIES: YicC/YloC family endoribonuclease [Cytobacillus]|uniref:YicC family protein n=1 Tax=Cytobacillus stercorigallinarum TaxID=2762240 RepID=A0ABR8QMM4_9BACI|nr:YicC/YloC family endoribonuclease [Cytobacillus stercorigallinarum]MBD7936780.1 YicC family protein [Cytobacillus stercorigallinarum]